MDKKNASWKDLQEYLAVEVIDQAKNNAKRWFVAWVITLAALIGTNAAWIYVFQSYDYVSQDGNGVNNYHSWNGGDMNNGAESEN